MPDFSYTARDLSGKKVAGKLSAASQQEVLALLDRQALFPIEIASEKPVTAGWGSRRVKPQLMATLYAQLADLLRSGVPLLKSFEVLRRQTSNKALSAILADVHDQIAEGRTLADCMLRHPRVFGEMAISMVRAGAEGGFLEEALQRVADFTEKQEDLKSRTQGALAYPAFLAVTITIVIGGLLIFFVPKFDALFDRLRQRGELPQLTEMLLGTSNILQRWWLPLLGIVVVGVVVLKVKLETEAGRVWFDRMKLRLPLISPIFRNLAVSRFCRVLGTLLQNGVPILRSLEISSDAAGNRVLAQAIREAAENISAGESLARPLAASGHFPPAVVEMIAVAEESATLDSVLVRISDGLDTRTWRQLDLLVRLLEPMMLLVFAVVVLMLAVALLLPVIKMSTTI